VSAKACNCGDPKGHARAVESAIFMCVVNAATDPDRQEHWWAHADKLESKFKTTHGRHYSELLGNEGGIP